MKITIERRYKKSLYTIGVMYIDGEKFSNTLEPADRGMACPIDANEVRYVKSLHMSGTTAIPTGSYKVMKRISGKFNAPRPFLRDVPGFDGIMIHEGNTRKDTSGCILVGENTLKAHVQNSRRYAKILYERITEAIARKEEVWVEIV